MRKAVFLLIVAAILALGGCGTADTGASKTLSDEQAVAAIQKYCYSANPELEDMVESGEDTIYWELSSSDEQEIVVVYRSYTGSVNYYYIERSTGETYVTEFVPGISEEEERTDESFNVWDYAD